MYRDEADGAETGYLLISREGAAVVKAAELETHVETGIAGTTSALGLVAEAPVVGFLGALVGHVLLPQAAASTHSNSRKKLTAESQRRMGKTTARKTALQITIFQLSSITSKSSCTAQRRRCVPRQKAQT